MNQLARIAAREAERKREADSEDEYKPPVKVAKAKSKRSSPRSKAGKTKLNTSAHGKVTDVGGKHPRHHHKEKGEASDSSGGSRIFQMGGHCFVTNGGAHILFSGKKCMKLKEIGLKWGGAHLLAPCYSKITIYL